MESALAFGVEAESAAEAKDAKDDTNKEEVVQEYELVGYDEWKGKHENIEPEQHDPPLGVKTVVSKYIFFRYSVGGFGKPPCVSRRAPQAWSMRPE